MLRRCTAILFLLFLAAPVQAADAAPTLSELIAKEPIADLARAARERGDAARGAVLFFQPFLTCAKCHDGDVGIQLGPDRLHAGQRPMRAVLPTARLSPYP